jgi:uncharacterized protein YegJ (DUF2314 family)
MADQAFATNPANVKPDFFVVLRHELTTLVVIAILGSIIFLPLGWFVWKWLWLGLLLIPMGYWAVFYGTSRVMRLGACCPAKVLSIEPPRLAVFTDMSMQDDASHPAVVIKEFSAKNITGARLKVGDKLAVATFYEPGDEEFPEERWKRLSVVQPVRSATSNADDIRRTLQSIDQEEWEQLDAGMKQLSPPYEESIVYLEAGRKVGGQGVAEGRVKLIDANDPNMEKVKVYGRKTFRFFLRELSWERRRIIPGLEMAAVKIAFSDPPQQKGNHPSDLDVEYMWVSDVEFDGKKITGVLLNQPDSIKSVKQGDKITASPSQIVDWAYSMMGEVCGGFTIQEMRRNMSKKELKQHDAAWGLEFGTPGVVRLVPDDHLPDNAQDVTTPIPDLAGISIQGDYKVIESLEHPMSVNMRSSMEEMLAKNPEHLESADDMGLTLLHQMAIAGSLDGVDVCLNCGVNPNQTAKNGMTAAKLAKGLGWKKVLSRLQAAGAEA